MGQIFPLVYETSRIRGILDILKQNGGSIGFSRLAAETDEQINDLFPLVEACKMLGFATVSKSTIKITPEGKKITLGNSLKMIRDRLQDIEPFMSAIEVLRREGEVSTEALFDKLKSDGIFLHGDKATNEILMKKMFLRLGVRSRLLFYDTERDIWSLGSATKRRG